MVGLVHAGRGRDDPVLRLRPEDVRVRGHSRGRFHLRCGDAGLFEIMRSTPAAFRGEYFSEHVRDFLVDRVAIELDHDTAIEAGGELLGRRRYVEVALGKPITMLALRRQTD